MDTKLKGDIAEQAAILEALQRGWGVLRPIGDRLPYDLVFDVNGTFAKIQVKAAWLDRSNGNYTIDNRRTKTNRRVMIREIYQPTDFDFALAYLPEQCVFYVIPVAVFTKYGSGISFVETERRQRKPQSTQYRDAWDLILQWAAHRKTGARSPVKFGEAFHMVIPSQSFAKVSDCKQAPSF